MEKQEENLKSVGRKVRVGTVGMKVLGRGKKYHLNTLYEILNELIKILFLNRIICIEVHL